ncbi:MAG: hypothetical protein Aureis2KO_22310 [Aureisphaera sp.]
MKVLGVNATYLSPDRRRMGAKEPIVQTQRMLARVPNLDLCVSYNEAILLLNGNASFDTVITSFTPIQIVHPSDKALISGAKDIESYRMIGGPSYFSAFYFFDKLAERNPDAHFIIYSGAYSGDRKPDSHILNFLEKRTRSFDWINKSDADYDDKRKIEKSIIDSRIELDLSLNADNQIVIVPRITRGPVDYRFDNESHLISRPSFVNNKYILNQEILEFQELINKDGVTEHQIQNFLERFPNFLLGSKYKSLRSQMHLKRYDKGDLIPDFILEPVNKNDFWKIVDLKLPDKRIVKERVNREGFNSQIMDALSQLRTYRNYFDNPEYRKLLQQQGIHAYKPELSVIIGQDYGNLSYEEVIEAKEPFKNYNFEILTFTDLLEHAHNLNKIL